jgi:predicted Zn-dependent protease
MGRQRKYLLLWGLIFGLALTLSLTGYAGFFDDLELSLEKQIGRSGYESIIAEYQVVRLSPEEEERLQNIFDRLVAACGRKNELEFSLTVVEDETVNAFALPAGYIFVHTGLLAYVENDGELAGVLAHEIAHVDRKHSMNAIKRQLGMALLFQLFFSDAGEEMAKIGNLALNLTQLGYGREAEYEADRYGVFFMEKAGYSRDEILNFWRRLVEQSGGGKDPAILQLFSTHPPTAERIKKIEDLPTPAL